VATLITLEMVRDALADHHKRKSYEIIDSRVPGLTLRVKPSDCRWSVRSRLWNPTTKKTEQRRWDLGRVVEGRDESAIGAGAITLSTARRWAMQVRDMCREEKDPSRTVAYMKAGSDGVKVHEAHVARAQEPASISWEAAKLLFLDEVLRTRRKGTHRDYRIKLGAAELTERFAGRLVSQITDVEAAEVYAQIFRRAEPMGDGCLRVMKRFWNWMRDASRVGVTGVTINLDKVRPLPKTLNEDGDPNRQFDPKRDLEKKSPPEIELGRALAIARSGVLPDWASYGLQLILASAQRRRQVIGANRYRFKDYEETPNEVAWFIPAYWRKTRKEGTERAHLVPVMGWGAEAVRKLDRLCDFEASVGWLFPALKGDGKGHQEINGFNKVLDSLPGVNWSPHGVRYGFTDYGERDLGFSRATSESKIILDHTEGVEPNDVTGRFYRSDPAIARKREMMQLWINWLDKWASIAIDDDPRLLDKDWLRAEIFKARNGEERFARRVASRNAKGVSLWGDKTAG